MSIEHIHKDICEKHILGPETRTCVVRADDSDTRPWLHGSPICGCLNDFRVAHCGIMHALRPFEIVRVHLSGTFFFACIEGEGQVLMTAIGGQLAPSRHVFSRRLFQTH